MPTSSTITATIVLVALVAGTFALPGNSDLPVAREVQVEEDAFENFIAGGTGKLYTRDSTPDYCKPTGPDADVAYYTWDSSDLCQVHGIGTYCCITWVIQNPCGEDLKNKDIDDLVKVVTDLRDEDHWYSTATAGKWHADYPLWQSGHQPKHVLAIWDHDINKLKGHLENSNKLSRIYFNYVDDNDLSTIFVERYC